MQSHFRPDPYNIPSLELTRGQVVFALWRTRPYNQGHAEPSKDFLAKLNYLRLNGVPFPDKKASPGSGKSLIYGFDELAELALAVELADHCVAPGDVVKMFTSRRTKLRTMCREALQRSAEQYKFADSELPLGLGLFIEVTIYSVGPKSLVNRIELLEPRDAVTTLLTLGTGASSAFFINLSEYLSNVVDMALAAPVTKRGRKRTQE